MASNGFHSWGKTFTGLSEGFGAILLQAVIWWALVKLCGDLVCVSKRLENGFKLFSPLGKTFAGLSERFGSILIQAVIWWAQVKLWAELFCVTKTLENGFKWFSSLGKKRLQAFLRVLGRFCYRPSFGEPKSNYELNFFVWANAFKTASNAFPLGGKTFAGLSERFYIILLQAALWWAQVTLWAGLFRQQTTWKWLQMVFILGKKRLQAFLSVSAQLCYLPLFVEPRSVYELNFLKWANALKSASNGFNPWVKRLQAFLSVSGRFCYRPPFGEPRSHYELNFFVWANALKIASNDFHPGRKTFTCLSEHFCAILLEAALCWAQVTLIISWTFLCEQTPWKRLQMVFTLGENVCRLFWAFRGDFDTGRNLVSPSQIMSWSFLWLRPLKTVSNAFHPWGKNVCRPFWAFLHIFATGRPLVSPGHIMSWTFSSANDLKMASNGFHSWGKTFAGLSEGFGTILLQAVIWWALDKLCGDLVWVSKRHENGFKWFQLLRKTLAGLSERFGEILPQAIILWAQVKLWAQLFCLSKRL